MPSSYCKVRTCWGSRESKHRFPNPAKNMSLFIKWVYLCGNKPLISELTPIQIYTSCRVCSLHFNTEDFGPNHRLKAGALPSVQLPNPLEIDSINWKLLEEATSLHEMSAVRLFLKTNTDAIANISQTTNEQVCSTSKNTMNTRASPSSVLFNSVKTPLISGLRQFNGCSPDNVNLGEISSEAMEIKIEPCEMEAVDDEKPIIIPELRLKCRTCMESVPDTAVSLTTMYFRSKSIKDAISELIPQLMPALYDEDVVCRKCLKVLEDTLLFIENTLKVNKLLVEKETDMRNGNISDSQDCCPPENGSGPCDVTLPATNIEKETLPATNIDKETSPALSEDLQQPNSHCCSDGECGNNSDQNMMGEDSDDCIKVNNSDLDDCFDESDDDIELFSDSSTDIADSGKQIKSSDGSNLVKKLRRINFSTFDNSDVEDNNSVVSVNTVKQRTASKLIFGLEKIGVKVLSSLDKPDLNNPLRKKRILLVGNETVKYCPLCSEEMFLTDDKLAEHFNEVHNMSKCFLLEPKLYYEKGRSVPRKVFNCPYCNEFVGEKQLGTHSERQHGDSKPYKCYRCKKDFRRYQQFSSHYCFSQIQPVQKKVKVKEKRKCAVCKEKISLELYIAHFDNHKIFKCERCSKRFTNKTSLMNHEELHHTKTELCPICGKIFNGVGLQLHMANHTDKKPPKKDFLCEFCPKSFSSNKNLRAHIKDVHFQSKMLCELCGEKCRASTLPAHIRLKHSKEAIYTCTICGEGFSRSDYFNRHVASHTQKKTHRGRNSSINGKGTPSKCEICSKQLTPANYYQHLNSHVTLKRFKCRFCNMSYNNYSNARRHEREHLKNPTYHIRCNICWKTFENNDDLNKHTDTHEKKYSCDECGKSFGRKFALSSHIAEAHTDEAEIERREESLRQSYGIGLRRRRRSKKRTIFDELGDLIKAENIEVVEEN